MKLNPPQTSFCLIRIQSSPDKKYIYLSIASLYFQDLSSVIGCLSQCRNEGESLWIQNTDVPQNLLSCCPQCRRLQPMGPLPYQSCKVPSIKSHFFRRTGLEASGSRLDRYPAVQFYFANFGIVSKCKGFSTPIYCKVIFGQYRARTSVRSPDDLGIVDWNEDFSLFALSC